MTDAAPIEASPRRRPKGDKRARTRARLLEAARELVREKGHARVSLDEVARRAGMTSGAIYGNFRNRDDLFIALADLEWAPIKPVFRPGSSFAEKMHALAEATLAAIPERRDAAQGRLRGMAHTLAHDEARARVQAVTAQRFAAGAGWLRAVADDSELSMPADLLVAVIHSLTEGLIFQRLLTPELVPDEAFYAAFAALARRTA